jgi:hypothetical protein
MPTWAVAVLEAAVPKTRAAAAIAGTRKFNLRIKSPRLNWKGDATCRLFGYVALKTTFRNDYTKKVARFRDVLVTVLKFHQ